MDPSAPPVVGSAVRRKPASTNKVLKIILLVFAIAALALTGLSILFFKFVGSLSIDDVTDDLAPPALREMALNRPWIVGREEGDLQLFVGAPGDTVATLKAEVTENGRILPADLDVIPAGIDFRIKKAIGESNIGVGRTLYHLTIEFSEGGYSGKQFEMVPASRLFDEVQGKAYGKPGSWILRTDILE